MSLLPLDEIRNNKCDISNEGKEITVRIHILVALISIIISAIPCMEKHLKVVQNHQTLPYAVLDADVCFTVFLPTEPLLNVHNLPALNKCM